MDIINKKLSELLVPEKNVRIHTEKQLQEYEKSVKMFGQIRPIVIDENNTIMAGRGLYDTLIRMGKETAACYQFTNLTENQKKKLMIADNKIFSLGIENLDTLNEFLVDLQGDLEIPGFDEEILKQMVSDAEDITEKIAEYGTLDEEEIQIIKDNSVKKEQKIQRMESGTETNEPKIEPVPTSIYQEPIESNNETAEIRKFVICPKCGEKIWL